MNQFHFSKRSQARLETVDPKLQLVFHNVLAMGFIDITIIDGHRSQDRQNTYFREGKSKLVWPNSHHNFKPSKAVDAAPWVGGRISWFRAHNAYLAGLVQAEGHRLGIPIGWGGNWDLDGVPITDQSFDDLVHYWLLEG